MKKAKPDGTKTLYAAGLYEVDKTSGGSVTRTVTYYPVAGAMRIKITGGSNTVYYILKDHLGSASVVTDATGTVVGEQRYYPYGETRFTSGSIYTDKLFTGQREMAGLGIYHFGTRFYSPKLGRFLSPDSIVPGAGNPQSLNRFAYTFNNPLRYTDPSGHIPCDEDGFCYDHGKKTKSFHAEEYARKNVKKPKRERDNEPNGQPIHDYTISNIVCPAAFACKQEQMTDYLSRFAFPGQDPSQPVVSGQDYYVTPFDKFKNDPDIQVKGRIQVDVRNGGLMTVNSTLSGHLFYNGVVERKLSQDPNGDWRVTTRGYGTNTSVGIGLVNGLFGPEIFQEVDDAMQAYIVAQYLPGALLAGPDQLIP